MISFQNMPNKASFAELFMMESVIRFGESHFLSSWGKLLFFNL